MAYRGARIVFGLLAALTGAAHAGPVPHAAPVPATIDFNRDVRPILSENCFACHGPDKNKRKADLRLDTKDGLLSRHDDVIDVVAGHPERSELYRRVTTDDPDERMPDPKSTKRLSPREIAVLKRWIEQGAEYKGHWAYLPPVRPQLPEAGDPTFVRNPIDRFVLAKLNEVGLDHAPEADRVTLARRLYFDLTGLPPTKAQVDAFVNDASPDAYEKLVDHLLADPHYGERMAVYWLDLVRYADTIGYHSDNPMNVSPYRDYVIHSFNANKPFDRFTVEQIAGDLLPAATTEQRVATAYNRLLQTTEEGGAQPKEYEQKYLADRVRSVSTVWMGVTLGCAQCHDHKFDPFTTREFYQLGAFFADVQEASTGRREPGMPVPDGRQSEELARLDAAIASARKELDVPAARLADEQARWEAEQGRVAVEWATLTGATLKAASSQLTQQPDGVIVATEKSGKFQAKDTYTIAAKTDLKGITAVRLEALPDDAFPAKGPGVSPNGNFVLTEFKLGGPDGAVASKKKDRKAKPLVKPASFKRATADFSQDGFAVAGAIDGKPDTGWAVLPDFGKAHTAVFEFDAPYVPDDGELTLVLEFQSIFPQHQIGRFRLSVTTSPDPSGVMPAKVKADLAVAPEKRKAAQRDAIAAYFRTIAPSLQPIRERIAEAEKQKADVLKAVRTCLATTAAGNLRTVRVLPRGNWMEESGEVVQPGTPAALNALNVAGRRPTRLDLANWIASRDNPLTARVFVNRLWKLYFGQGLSKVLDDLGAQGEWPTHPELLDWLASEFVDSGWDVKHITRLLVTSGAYRQSSKPTAEQKERDPYNRLYARQSRFRLDAEFVRDNALSVSGLLVNAEGGPSVFPYQPPGYWFALNFPPREWQNDKGDGLYRRGLYTHWQRSFPQPSLLAFDAPSREEAVCERNRSNIPQQALVLLNDPTYVEAARTLAERIIREGGGTTRDGIRWAFGDVVSREPSEEESGILTDLYDKHRKAYHDDPAAAQKLLTVGDRPAPKDVDVADLAAWTSVARTILNLGEAITRY